MCYKFRGTRPSDRHGDISGVTCYPNEFAKSELKYVNWNVKFVLYELCQLECQMNCPNRIVKTKLNRYYVNLCQYKINEICQKDYVNWIMSP